MGYISKVKNEIQKVVFPTKDKLIKDTGIVLLTCTIFATAFWLVNTVILFGLKALIG